VADHGLPAREAAAKRGGATDWTPTTWRKILAVKYAVLSAVDLTTGRQGPRQQHPSAVQSITTIGPDSKEPIGFIKRHPVNVLGDLEVERK